MAKTVFYARRGDDSLEVSFTDHDGKSKTASFSGGKFETSDAFLTARLTELAENPDSPVTVNKPQALASSKETK